MFTEAIASLEHVIFNYTNYFSGYLPAAGSLYTIYKLIIIIRI